MIGEGCRRTGKAEESPALFPEPETAFFRKKQGQNMCDPGMVEAGGCCLPFLSFFAMYLLAFTLTTVWRLGNLYSMNHWSEGKYDFD